MIIVVHYKQTSLSEDTVVDFIIEGDDGREGGQLTTNRMPPLT
jgi:hypothetical protein